jgi:hypothetical protein
MQNTTKIKIKQILRIACPPCYRFQYITSRDPPLRDCHSGLDPESSISGLDVLARCCSLRLPSVAPLEFTPYLIRGGNDSFGTHIKKRWTDYVRVVRSEEK